MIWECIKQAIIDVNIGCAHGVCACLGIMLMGCVLAWIVLIGYVLAWGLCLWDVCLLGDCAHGMCACLGECPWCCFERRVRKRTNMKKVEIAFAALKGPHPPHPDCIGSNLVLYLLLGSRSSLCFRRP